MAPNAAAGAHINRFLDPLAGRQALAKAASAYLLQCNRGSRSLLVAGKARSHASRDYGRHSHTAARVQNLRSISGNARLAFFGSCTAELKRLRDRAILCISRDWKSHDHESPDNEIRIHEAGEPNRLCRHKNFGGRFLASPVFCFACQLLLFLFC